MLLNLVFTKSHAQAGGGGSMSFLNIPGISKVGALGGVNISSYHDNAGMFMYNPALLHEDHDNVLSLHQTFYFANISNSQVSYAKDLGKAGIWAAGIQYMNYGTIDAYDNTGQEDGTFSVADYAISIAHMHRMGDFQMGAGFKIASSRLITYNSTALMLDLGGIYRHPTSDFTVGMAVRNLGFVISDYTAYGDSELLPEVETGTTFKPEHLPFRFSFTLYNLLRAGEFFYDEDGNVRPGNLEPSLFNKGLRHIVVGTELILSNNFQLRFGYNHRKRQELRLNETAGGAGISYGMHWKWRGAALDMSRMHYHAAGALTQLGIQIDFNKGFKSQPITIKSNDDDTGF
ncbi:MAG: type IX secretion system protein PorQ [Cyclobacteriaceae bacterium]